MQANTNARSKLFRVYLLLNLTVFNIKSCKMGKLQSKLVEKLGTLSLSLPKFETFFCKIYCRPSQTFADARCILLSNKNALKHFYMCSKQFC